MSDPTIWILTGAMVAIILWVVYKVLAGRRVSRLPKSRRFSQDRDRVVATAVDVVSGLKYELVKQDVTGITFKTGLSWRSWSGQTMTATIQPLEGVGTEVRLDGSRNPTFQVYDNNESDYIAQRFLKELTTRLGGSLPDVRTL